MDYRSYVKYTRSSEITIDKEDIFYREKYNEIMSYIKALLLNVEDSEMAKVIKIKGSLLINISPATDVIDFIKVICNHYYLELIQLNYDEISKDATNFFNNFNLFIKKIGEEAIIKPDDTKDVDGKPSKGKTNKRLLLIDQRLLYKELFNNKSLLQKFVSSEIMNGDVRSLIERNTILIWINYDYEEIRQLSNKVFNAFDLLIKIPRITLGERETILRNLSDKNEKIIIDTNSILKITEEWEVLDIKNLLTNGIFRFFINPEVNEKGNDITQILVELVESGEYIPTIPSENDKQDIDNESLINGSVNKTKNNVEKNEGNQTSDNVESILEQIRNNRPSEFMLNQLYEDAASKHYSELLIIIDKLVQNENLEKMDRKLLALYPFILNDEPNKAKISLERGKKRIDIIKQAFNK